MKWGIAALASMAFLAGAWAREESTPITNGQGVASFIESSRSSMEAPTSQP